MNILIPFFQGTRNSLDCTLILTEGDSAKTLAVAGLGVVGRDKYGVYPLRGKLLNVREATHKQVSLLNPGTSEEFKSPIVRCCDIVQNDNC
jgi:hypothetical protein